MTIPSASGEPLTFGMVVRLAGALWLGIVGIPWPSGLVPPGHTGLADTVDVEQPYVVLVGLRTLVLVRTVGFALLAAGMVGVAASWGWRF